MLIGPHRCDKQAKKPKREEIVSRGSKRDRKEGKRSQRQQQEQLNQDREKRARIDQEEDRDEDQMMDTDQVEDISVVGTRKSTSHSKGAIGVAFSCQSTPIGRCDRKGADISSIGPFPAISIK